jgi:dynein heavy chain 2
LGKYFNLFKTIYLFIYFSENSIQFKLSNSSQTQSSIEAIKATYYHEMKRFLTVPLTFKGCRDISSSSKKKLIFENIILRHNDDIIACYKASNELFNRLEHGLEQFQEWTVLGQVDIEELVDKYLIDVADWEKNFRVLKIRGQDAEKLPK